MALPTEHGKTAKTMLKMKWNYPVHQLVNLAATAENSGTVSKAVRRALDKQVAFYEVAGEDRRPLLVLRECRLCNGTDDALLSRGGGNERILIMTRWFNCVKLPIEVLEDDHPFAKLFPEDHPPHLFLARWDGSEPLALRGDMSRTELTGHMYAMLKSEYKKPAERVVKDIEKIISQYDVIDEKIARLEIGVDAEIEKNGPESRKLKKLIAQLKDAEKEMADNKKKEAKLSVLGLKKPDEKPKDLDGPVAKAGL
jgi:hypothetical protein